VLIALSLLLCPLVSGCTQNKDFDSYLHDITKPYRFDFVKWELHAFGEEIGKLFSRKQDVSGEGVAEVTRYFSNVARIKKLESGIEAIQAGNRQGDLAALEDELGRLHEQNAEAVDIIERLLETQIREALSQQGIFHPLNKYVGIKVGFPPVNFELGRPPHLLVISPRHRIESMREVALLPEMSREDMENLEAEVDKLGVSSLVVRLGGMATYPSHVTDRADLQFVLNTAAEEWVHQYLAFKPLGFLYVLDLLGIRRDYEIATMNETLAGMVSKEIGASIYEKYYISSETDTAEPEAMESGFDFNKEMREIRRAVDNYLAQGEIERAEEFMKAKRQYLAENGYYIRKLNQAYFAFHGTYADRPTSISPIGVELKQLRSQSDSLKDFLETVASMTDRQELTESIR
jgi:hypothetical protein